MISDMQDMERRADEKKWIKLICNVGDLNPELAVTWYNSKGIIDLPQSPVSGLEDCKNKQSGFYELSGTNNLVICLPSHKPYTGTYKCEARYRMVVTSKSVHLNVLRKLLWGWNRCTCVDEQECSQSPVHSVIEPSTLSPSVMSFHFHSSIHPPILSSHW